MISRKIKNLIEEFFVFIRKQSSSALFGGSILVLVLITKYVSFSGIYRYDLLFILAVIIQVILILTKAEEPREVLAIIIFHICAMAMEIFKTSPMVGSWTYPEPAFFVIASVPLFSGFMYSSVGSYMARSWRINNFKFIDLPKNIILLLLGLTIYVNFFTNYFTFDVRYILFVIAVICFWNTKFYVTLTTKTVKIHPLFANALLALFVWLGEQIGSFAKAWVYPNQENTWQPVSLHMYTSWYMLLIFSFIIIVLIYGKEKEVVYGSVE